MHGDGGVRSRAAGDTEGITRVLTQLVMGLTPAAVSRLQLGSPQSSPLTPWGSPQGPLWFFQCLQAVHPQDGPPLSMGQQLRGREQPEVLRPVYSEYPTPCPWEPGPLPLPCQRLQLSKCLALEHRDPQPPGTCRKQCQNRTKAGPRPAVPQGRSQEDGLCNALRSRASGAQTGRLPQCHPVQRASSGGRQCSHPHPQRAATQGSAPAVSFPVADVHSAHIPARPHHGGIPLPALLRRRLDE